MPVLGEFATTPGGIDAGYSTSGATSLGITPINHSADPASNRPKAYLNYIFINRNFDLSSVKIDTARLLGGAENGSNVAHYLMTLEEVVTEPGYVYVYLSSDGEEVREVYFDDFKVGIIFLVK